MSAQPTRPTPTCTAGQTRKVAQEGAQANSATHGAAINSSLRPVHSPMPETAACGFQRTVAVSVTKTPDVGTPQTHGDKRRYTWQIHLQHALSVSTAQVGRALWGCCSLNLCARTWLMKYKRAAPRVLYTMLRRKPSRSPNNAPATVHMRQRDRQREMVQVCECVVQRKPEDEGKGRMCNLFDPSQTLSHTLTEVCKPSAGDGKSLEKHVKAHVTQDCAKIVLLLECTQHISCQTQASALCVCVFVG